MDNNLKSQLVIDLKKSREEVQASNYQDLSSKNSSGFLGFFVKFFKKKDKEINFLNSQAENQSGLRQATRLFRSGAVSGDMDGEDQDINKDFYNNDFVAPAKQTSSFWDFILFPLRLLRDTWWLFIFLIKFFFLLNIRLSGLAKQELRKLARPKFGTNPRQFSLATLLRSVLRFPLVFVQNIGNLISSPEARRESRRQQMLLFQELSGKTQSSVGQAIVFAALIFLLILPFKAFSYYQVIGNDDLKGKVLGATTEAIANLKSAQSSIGDLKMSDASLDFLRAGDSFRQAKTQLEELDGVILQLAKIFPQQDIRLAGLSKEILTMGEEASQLGINLSLAFNSLIQEEEGKNTPLAFDKFLKHQKDALHNVSNINNILSQINVKDLPQEYRETFALLQEKIGDLEITLAAINQLGASVKIFLGMDYDQRYLFVFQNNNEARATGGFIGSFALIDFSQGKIKNIEIPGGGSYDTEGGLYTEVVSPAPLHLVNPMWHFWDANWWPDWEKSAKKLIWFYEKSGGPTVDGVISVTPTVLEKILQITGPIDMTDTHGVVMTADNFWINIRSIIEEEKKDESALPGELVDNKPKKIIGEFFQRLMTELPNHLNRESIVKFLSAAESSLREKQVLFYFKDEDLQEEVVSRNWAGKMKDTAKDYLLVVNTNIAGGKSDKAIKQVIDHSAAIADDGSIINTLKISRKHTATNGEPFFGVRNVNWLRIYVPEGSELIKASGFRGPDPVYFEEPEADWMIDPDILAEENGQMIDKDNQNTFVYQEGNKTVFANWSMIDPGEEGLITLKYKLPFKLDKQEPVSAQQSGLTAMVNKIMQVEKKELYVYSLLLQKQPGQRFTTINSKLDLADNFTALWKYPEQLNYQQSGWDFSQAFNQDEYLALILTVK